jgi:hypothetical protein
MDEETRPRAGRAQHLGATNPPPHAEWVFETSLYTLGSAIDESAKTRFARWRRDARVFGKLHEDGGVLIAVHPGTMTPIMADDPYGLAAGPLESHDDRARHLALELKLRTGPTFQDGSWDKPFIRFPLTHAEFEEIDALRELHGWGPELGDGPTVCFWRPAGDETFSTGGAHKSTATQVLWGRALTKPGELGPPHP